MTTRALLVTAVCLLALSARADDWPRFRGPDFDNASKEKGCSRSGLRTGRSCCGPTTRRATAYSAPAIVG